MTKTVHFYFDYVSPYAHLAAQRVDQELGSAGVEIVPVPVLFAALLDRWGSKGPAEIAPKRAFMFKDVFRKAARWGVSVSLPAFHPFNPLLALRVTVAAEKPALQRVLMRALFESAWVRGEHLESREVVAAAIARAGLDPEVLLGLAESEDVKDLLRAHTRSATQRGVFGVPSFAIDDELFWGSDVLDDVRAYLAGEDAAPKDMFRRLVALKPSAVRRRSEG